MISIKVRSGIYLLVLLSILLGGCEKSEPTPLFSACDQKAVVDEGLYESGPSDRVDIHDVEIEGDCLRIKFGASGCSGESWKVELVSSEFVVETLPCIRYIRLSLDNNEDCLAYIGKEVSFDITNFQAGGDEVILVFPDSDHQIRYTY